MDLTSMPTSELVRVASSQAPSGTISEDILKELGTRYAYRACPPEEKSIIAEFDRNIIIPLFGFTRLPPATMLLPGAKLPPVPRYYERVHAAPASPEHLVAKSQTENSPALIPSGPGNGGAAKAFISYSHKDADLLAQLHEHLSALRRQNLIDTWTDRDIDVGGIIDDEVRQQMEAADLYLLLVSSAFIESDYCFQKEFSRACERQEAGHARVVPIIVRECDWKIPALRKFKALPQDGKPVISRHWHTQDEAFTNVAAGLRALLEKGASPGKGPRKTSKPPKEKFVPDDRHVTEGQREELRKICDEIVDRLTASLARRSDEEVKKAKGRWFGIVWSQFNEHFGTTEHGLPSLPRERFEDAKSWLRQYRASKDKNFKRANPQKYRNTLTKAIYAITGKLGWTKQVLYAFASEKVGYAEPITTLDSLGNSQLELVRDRIRYELKKRTVKSGQAKARRASP